MSTLRRHGLFMKGGGVTYAYYIYGIPRNSTTVLKIDPSTDTATTFGNLAGTIKWLGGVLADNGMIYGIPLNSTSILKIDPSTDTATTFGNLAGTLKWVGGVLASVPVGSNLLSIPANLADLPGSAYNQHCNKL